jgi:hypothetical protein
MPPPARGREGKRQRFYARNTVNTTLPWPARRLMQSSTTDDPFHSRYSSEMRPALTSFADEVTATVARVFAYVGVIALFGILGVHAWDQVQLEWTEEPSTKTGWSAAERASPAFALSRQGISNKVRDSETYLVSLHSSGGRKDVIRWRGSGDKALAELEIYRPGAEYGSISTARADLAARMLSPAGHLESAGVIETKFGGVALLRQAGANDNASCLGFLKRIDDPTLQISGWSCQGDGLPARRPDIACMLNQVMPLGPGNDSKLSQLFVRPEPQGAGCPPLTVAADWISAKETPILRGSL